MPERDGYIPGVPCWIDTTQSDPDAAAAFYGALFGWEAEDRMPPGSDAKYLIASLRGGEVAAIAGPAAPADGPPVWTTYVAVARADDAAARVRDAGGEVVSGPFDVHTAGRMAICRDGEGADFCVWEARDRLGLRVVNEPGALNFNVLNTRDQNAAEAFYGAVFGWRTFALPGGATAWALPGYGDHLEELAPGTRARTAEFGVPGFEDVVAAITPIPGDQPQTAPHWSVTFGAADADATAAQTAALGGEVVVPPFDGPFVRMTVLRDPQGAAFTASQFVAENR